MLNTGIIMYSTITSWKTLMANDGHYIVNDMEHLHAGKKQSYHIPYHRIDMKTCSKQVVQPQSYITLKDIFFTTS